MWPKEWLVARHVKSVLEVPTMKTHLPVKSEPIRVELLRDQLVVVHPRGGDLPALKKALAKNRRHLKTMPSNIVDTVSEIRKIRDSGGRD